MSILAAIIWDVNPELFRIGDFGPRWYGLMFATGFLVGYFMVERFFKRENLPLEWLDSLLLYLVVGTIIGARLGHVIFYEPMSYLEHPEEILMIWHGGLASHGGVIGVILALIIWSRRVGKMPPLWIMDRVATPIALAGFFIRMGNLMNSEIVGKATDLPWAFDFVNNPVYPGPRHPAQLYEALCYLGIFGILFYFYKKGKASSHMGFLSGLLLSLIFTARFFIEFLKENQVDFEDGMPLNMGQILSIPIVLISLYLVFRPARPIENPKVKTQTVKKEKKKKV